MSFNKLKPALRPSITRWVASFFGLAGLTLLGMGALGMYQLYKLDNEIAEARTQSARLELTDAMHSLQGLVQRQGSMLGNWDETRQQLVNPDYYSYWKSSRVQSAGLLSNLFQSLDLYDANAESLPGAAPGKLSHPPVSSVGTTLYFPAKGLERITHVVPVYADSLNQVILGYAQVEFDLIKALKQNRSFSTFDPGTLSTDYSGSPLPLEQLAPHLKYEILSPREFIALKHTVINTYIALALVLLIAAGIAYLAIQRRLARPLVELASAIGNLKPDESQLQPVATLSVPFPLLELDTVRQSVQAFRQKLGDARIELENRNIAFQKQALQDALTGAFNRRAFDKDWEDLTRGLTGQPLPMAFLLFDCDHFKPINDTYGHHTGDKVLQMVADAVSQVLRTEDKLYRIGGDEFITILSGADEETTMQIAKRCLENVRAQNFRRYGILEPVGISIGIALGTVSSAGDLTRMQARADAAMYQAKRPGSLKIALYREDDITTDDALVASLEANALYQALANPEKIEMHYQRMQPLDGGSVYFEALCRIRHDNGLLSPARFMPIVQSRRLDIEFDLAVIRRIQASIEAGHIPPDVGVSINLSAQSLNQPEIITLLIELTAHINTHPLILEITETSLVPRLDEISYFLELLRSSGYRIALDDFGSGYSPLRYLSDLPVDIIKFDLTLIHQLQDGGRAGLVVADFARLMIDAGYTLIAEGVESEAQFAKVKAFGFSFAQGFYIERPKPVGELVASES